MIDKKHLDLDKLDIKITPNDINNIKISSRNFKNPTSIDWQIKLKRILFYNDFNRFIIDREVFLLKVGNYKNFPLIMVN